jgi:hypothetical protein
MEIQEYSMGSKYSGERKRQLLRISQEVGRDADLGPSESAPSSTCNGWRTPRVIGHKKEKQQTKIVL